MKSTELRKKSIEDLRETLTDYQKKVGTLRFDSERKKVKNVKELKWIKRDIARIHTILREKQS